MEFTSISVTQSEDSYAIRAALTVAKLEDWMQVEAGEEMVVTINAEDITLLVESKSRSQQWGQDTYQIEASSPAVKMDAPWTDPITDTWAASTVETIAQELCDLHGITLDWQIADWSVTDYSVEGQTPIQIILGLITEAARATSLPDGSLRVQYHHPTSPTQYDTATPGLELSDFTHILDIQSRSEFRPGYNAVEVMATSSTVAGEGVQLMLWTGADGEYDPELPSTQKLVGAICWPYRDITLRTSHSGAVIFPQGMDTWTYSEVVEIVNGRGSLRWPAHAVTSTDYGDSTDLGAVTANGAEVTTATVGESLLEIEYTGRVQTWKVEHSGDDQVQVYVEDDEAADTNAPTVMTVSRGAGDAMSPDTIMDDRLTTREIMLQRGRNYLDERQFEVEQFTIQTVLMATVHPGAVAEVTRAAQDAWRGKLSGWTITLQGQEQPKMTWNITRYEI